MKSFIMCYNFKPSGKAWHVYMLVNQTVLGNVPRWSNTIICSSNLLAQTLAHFSFKLIYAFSRQLLVWCGNRTVAGTVPNKQFACSLFGHFNVD